MLKKGRRQNHPELIKKARAIDKEFKFKLIEEKRKKIRNTISPTDNRSFWKAVDLAKNEVSKNTIPATVTLDSNKYSSTKDKSNAFASHFHKKMSNSGAVNNLRDDDNFLGNTMLQLQNEEVMMTEERLERAIKETKKKPSFGHNRVPMKV